MECNSVRKSSPYDRLIKNQLSIMTMLVPPVFSKPEAYETGEKGHPVDWKGRVLESRMGRCFHPDWDERSEVA